MAGNNLSTKNEGDVISADDPNQFKQALDQDLVPRNVSGVPVDEGGSLGTSLLRWANAFLKKITVGVAANLVTIEESASALLFKFNGTLGGRVTAEGIDGSTIANNSTALAIFSDAQVPGQRRALFTSSGVLVIPAHVHRIWILGCGPGGSGGAGGGGAGGGGAGGGGQGGSASKPFLVPMEVAPGDEITITVTLAGASATGGANTGAAGQYPPNTLPVATTVRNETSLEVISFAPGRPGRPGVGSSGGGGGGTPSAVESATLASQILGGTGGAGGSSGSSGDGETASQAIPGTGPAGGGGGGGGSSRYGTGGSGGQGGSNSGGSHGGNATGFGAGGGGGGGGHNGNAGGNGGSGGPGMIMIFWTGPEAVVS